MACRLNGVWVGNDNRFHRLKFRWNTEELPALDPTKEYYLGIDQSLANTGIYLRSTDYRNFIQTEFQKVDKLSDVELANDIGDFLDRITTGLHVKIVVLEEPLKFTGRQFGKTVARLTSLVAGIKLRLSMNPSTSKATVVEINNKRWKKYLKYDDRPKGMSDNKYYIAKDICRRFKHLEYMMNYSKDTYDSYDAVGILEGYLIHKYGDKGRIVGQVNRARMVGVPVYANSPQDLTSKLPRVFKCKRHIVKYNDTMTLYQNIKCCPSDLITSIRVDDPLGSLCIKWIVGEGRLDDKLFMIVIRKSKLTNSDLLEIESKGLKVITY